MNSKIPGRVDKRITDELGAYIQKGVLYIRHDKFEETMYALAYQIKGDETCHYCGCKLTKHNRTLDHLYPRDHGGISIVDNLAPCCEECNTRKRNLSEEEFRTIDKLQSDFKSLYDYEREVYLTHENNRRCFGVSIPHSWYELKRNYEVLAPVTSVDRYKRMKEYIRISDLYEQYGRICKPVVVTKNNIVVDGFLALMFAKNLPEKLEVPFITLSNVIAI